MFSVRRHISLLWSCLDLVFHFKGYVSTESIFRWVISLLMYEENRQSKQGNHSEGIIYGRGLGINKQEDIFISACLKYHHVSKKWHTRWGETQAWRKEARNSHFVYLLLLVWSLSSLLLNPSYNTLFTATAKYHIKCRLLISLAGFSLKVYAKYF